MLSSGMAERVITVDLFPGGSVEYKPGAPELLTAVELCLFRHGTRCLRAHVLHLKNYTCSLGDFYCRPIVDEVPKPILARTL